ncbi:PD-(D/E)XK nuclease family protein [Brevibacillus sp. 179-C9.3 HS]|uniref:PD-(D/E)XK nuclease family protein n=1 Tax=unclassified Brevibacillus TaxID=2684853 RepID=UPI0039A38A1B
MNHRWLVDLDEICKRDPFQRKILLADSHNQAEQWLARVTRECGPLLGVETETLQSLVVKRTKLELISRGFQLLNSEQTFWIVQNLMLSLSNQMEDYIPGEMVTPGIVKSFHQAIEDLRLAGIHSYDLSHNHFDTVKKGIYIIELLKMYEEWLKQNRCTDFVGLLNYLPESNDAVHHDLFIMRDVDRLPPVKLEMVRRIAGSELVVLRPAPPFPRSLEDTDSHHIHLFRAAGNLAEIREVFRRICHQQIPFDQTEIIVSDYAAYYTAIYTLSQVLDIPCTFSKGLPVSCTKTGKAALVYLEWLESNYDVDCLLKGLRHGYLSFRHFGESITTSDLIRALEKSGIGWGRERYSILKNSTVHTDDELTDEMDELLGKIFTALFEKLPDSQDESWTPLTILYALIDFLKRCSNLFSEIDNKVLHALHDQAQLLEMVSPHSLSNESSLRYVKEMVENIRINHDGPSPGKLHISSLQDGGQSGRTHTFVMGMSNNAWSTQSRQDPVLLDEERRRIGGLSLSAEQAEYIYRERAARLGMLSGTVTFSYTSYDPTDQKEMSPAYELLQVARIVSGDFHMDMTGLEHVLGKTIGYFSIGKQGEYLLDGTDRWLDRLTDNGIVQNGYPSLQQAFRSVFCLERSKSQVNDNVLSEYEGIIQTDVFSVSYRNNPEVHLSVTQLERYAECPKKFFFSTVLSVRMKDTTSFDRTRWLDAASRGSLLHRIFCLYLDEMSQSTPSGDSLIHHEHRLQEITEQTIREYQALVPPPSPHIFQKECESIRRDVAIFYQMEQQHSGRPRYFELELSKEGEPMEVNLGNGLVIRMKGFVDRVDELGPHTYKIYDYKTGSPSKFDVNEYFSQGKQLQHAIYAVAVEQWLRETGIDTEANVVEASYYFPTERGKAEEVSRIQNRRTELSELVEHLLTSIETGTYVATKETKRCTYCDYRSVCGNESDRAKEKWDLAENAPRLHSLKEVERFA